MMTDTLESSVCSKRGKKYGQVYCTHFGWARAYGIPTKGTAHETLSNLLKRNGFQNVIICDGSKEQTLGKFKKKAKENNIHMNQIGPYSPWSNQAEQFIRKLQEIPHCSGSVWAKVIRSIIPQSHIGFFAAPWIHTLPSGCQYLDET